MTKIYPREWSAELQAQCPWLNIDEFFSTQDWLASVGVYQLFKHGGETQGGYEMQQVPSEFSLVLCWLKNTGKEFRTFLEIGAAQGGASRVFNEVFKFNKHYTMDLNRLLDYKSSQPSRERNFKGLGIIEFDGDSHGEDGKAKLKEWDEKFDLIHIDGDHTYNGVSADFQVVMPYCVSGTRIVFHDSFENHAVRTLMNEVQLEWYPGYVWEFDTHFVQDHGSTVIRKE